MFKDLRVLEWRVQSFQRACNSEMAIQYPVPMYSSGWSCFNFVYTRLQKVVKANIFNRSVNLRKKFVKGENILQSPMLPEKEQKLKNIMCFGLYTEEHRQTDGQMDWRTFGQATE